MKLLTKELEKRFMEIGHQEDIENPIVVAKFFYPRGNWTWYAVAYDSEERLFFGYVIGLEKEWGYFSLDELENFQDEWGVGIERDLYFRERRIGEICPEAIKKRMEVI